MSTILFVEDSSICREPLAAMLRLKGYETICARDGREALAEIRRRVPDLVLLDIAMPEMDGLSFLRILRGQPQFRNIPVMLLTATTDRDCILKARELGVSGCLLKSHFSLEEMLSRIAGVWENSRRSEVRRRRGLQLRRGLWRLRRQRSARRRQRRGSAPRSRRGPPPRKAHRRLRVRRRRAVRRCAS